MYIWGLLFEWITEEFVRIALSQFAQIKFNFFELSFMKNEDLKFLFVTANTNESNALIESKMIDWESDRIISDRQKSDISLYRVGKIKSTGHFVIHFQLLEQGSSGVNASLTSVDSAIKQWSPDAVICLGIAFGKGGEDQKIGDVLVSDSIIKALC